MTENLPHEPPIPEWKTFAAEVCGGEAFGLFCDLYRNGLEGHKTRRVGLIGRRCAPEIFNTFLGFEIKAIGKRILCPDMTTARYLRIFTEIDMKDVHLPYDVTRTQDLLPDLERAYHSLKLILDFFSDQLLSKADQVKFRRSVYLALKHALVNLSPTKDFVKTEKAATAAVSSDSPRSGETV